MILQNNNNERIKKYEFWHSRLKYYNSYREYLNTLDISDNTIEWRLKHIRGFLYILDLNKISISRIKIIHVYEYLSSLTNLSARTKEHRARCIKKFLNWLYENKVINISGTLILPYIKTNKDEKNISYYTDEEITKIINSVDINEPNGKRDLAIILLFAYLGIRSNDLTNLKINDIKWNENLIIIVHTKNSSINSFIMPESLRYALIDYLKNERPKIESPYVFINDNNTLLLNQKIHRIISYYFLLSGVDIENKKHGPHSLRHSLATSIINKNHSIYDVANILGHSNLREVNTYAKVDFKTLKNISLEVPTWKD